MSFLIAFTKISVRWALWLAAVSGAVYALLLVTQSALQSHFWPVETLARLSGIAGFDFEISETGCDVIAKESWINVYASTPGQIGKALLFEYVPAGTGPIASVTAVGEHAVKISVPWISSEHFRRHRWRQLAVTYDIGTVDYPDTDPD
jgi:hypothetical protein